MKSSIFNAVGDFFALDIGSSAIRVVQLHGGGTNRALVKYGSAPVDVKLAQSDAVSDQAAIAQMAKSLIDEVGITTKNVVVGIPSAKSFVSVVDLPKMSAPELKSTIKYQADQYVPMSAEDAKTDAVILGDSPTDPAKMEVLLASVSNKFSEQRMDMLESIGFNVIALEPDSLALARSLTSVQDSANAQLILDMGEYTTDVIITLQGTPRLVRSIPTGGQTLLKTAMQNLNIDENQARQFVYKFGLDQTKLEGQIYRALSGPAEVVATEVKKSIEFFRTRYQGVQLSGIVTSGAAAVLPGFHQYLSAAASNAPVQAGNSWQHVTYSNSAHEQLMMVNHQFAVAIGLAERVEA